MRRGFRSNVMELDLTYRCTLVCANCTRRSDVVSGDGEDIDIDTIKESLIKATDEIGHKFNCIFLMGGEPTLHPKFEEIMEILLKYVRTHPWCRISLVTNYQTEHSKEIADSLPESVEVRRATKFIRTRVGTPLGKFWTVNVAPVDFQEFEGADYSLGCRQQKVCGLQMDTSGKFYPCSLAGSVDRIFKLNMGVTLRNVLKKEVYSTVFERLCRYCGRFRLKYADTLYSKKELCFDSIKQEMFDRSCEEYPLYSDKLYLSRSWMESLAKFREDQNEDKKIQKNGIS